MGLDLASFDQLSESVLALLVSLGLDCSADLSGTSMSTVCHVSNSTEAWFVCGLRNGLDTVMRIDTTAVHTIPSTTPNLNYIK